VPSKVGECISGFFPSPLLILRSDAVCHLYSFFSACHLSRFELYVPSPGRVEKHLLLPIFSHRFVDSSRPLFERVRRRYPHLSEKLPSEFSPFLFSNFPFRRHLSKPGAFFPLQRPFLQSALPSLRCCFGSLGAPLLYFHLGFSSSLQILHGNSPLCAGPR